MNSFVVSTKKEDYTLRFNFTPTSSQLSQNLFKFDKNKGVELVSNATQAYEEESITDDIIGKLRQPGAAFVDSEMVSIQITKNDSSNQLSENAILSSNNNN